jgi:hypothetical protein
VRDARRLDRFDLSKLRQRLAKVVEQARAAAEQDRDE